MLTTVSVGVFTRNVWNIAPVTVMLLVVGHTREEEEFLKQHLGQDYINFCNSRKRFLPGVI